MRMLNTVFSWLGCKESNQLHKQSHITRTNDREQTRSRSTEQTYIKETNLAFVPKLRRVFFRPPFFVGLVHFRKQPLVWCGKYLQDEGLRSSEMYITEWNVEQESFFVFDSSSRTYLTPA